MILFQYSRSRYLFSEFTSVVLSFVLVLYHGRMDEQFYFFHFSLILIYIVFFINYCFIVPFMFLSIDY
jgi:hypothetical protein